MKLKRRQRVPVELRHVVARLRRLDKGLVVPRLDVSAEERRLADLLATLPPGPVDEKVIQEFDDFVESFVPQWRSQIHHHFAPLLTELRELHIKIAPHLARYDALAEDDRQQLAVLDKAVTDALYTIADDDQPRQNPFRNDPRHANPPLADRQPSHPDAGPAIDPHPGG